MTPAQSSVRDTEDLGLKSVNRSGTNSQNEEEHVPTVGPLGYANEIIQLFKLAGPVVSSGFDTAHKERVFRSVMELWSWSSLV